MAITIPTMDEAPLNMSNRRREARDVAFLNVRPQWARPRFSFAFHETRSPRLITGIVFTLIFVMAFGGGLMVMPGLRLWEDIICHHYYNALEGKGHIGFEGHIDEESCKVDEVQNQMNIFLAVLGFLGVIPGLLMTIPYGLLADRKGRKPVFALSAIGILLAGSYNMLVMSLWKFLPYQLLWLSPVFMLIGGGPAVMSMMFFAMGCDITTEANRTNLFLYGQGAGLLGNLIAPSVAGGIMAVSPWISMILGYIILALGCSMIVLIPETLQLRPSASGTLVDASPAERDLSPTRKMDTSASYFTAIQMRIMDGLYNLKGSAVILHSAPVVTLLLTFLALPFGSTSFDLSIRYISKRFHWKLREVAFLLSLLTFVNLVLVAALIPLLSNYLMRRLKFSSKGKDLFLARTSIVVLSLGALLVASSGTVGLTIFGLIVWILGSACSSFTRSLITTLVDQQHVGRLFAAISIMETVGALLAGPSVNGLYSIGLKKGGSWIGLPFYCLTVIFFLTGVGIWSFGILTRKQRRRQDVPFGEEYGDDYADATTIGDLVVMEPNHADEGRIRI